MPAAAAAWWLLSKFVVTMDSLGFAGNADCLAQAPVADGASRRPRRDGAQR